MKKINYLFCLSLLMFFSSCEKNDPSLAISDKIESKVLAPDFPPGEILGIDVIKPNSTFPFITKHDLNRKNSISDNLRTSNIMGPEVFGPYDVTSTLTQVHTNFKMVIAGTSLPTAIYFCDVYRAEAVVTIPQDAIMSFKNPNGASNYGYSNYQTMERGVSVVQQVGNKYTLATYHIIPRYNVSGQRLGIAAMPLDVSGTVYTYSYVTGI